MSLSGMLIKGGLKAYRQWTKNSQTALKQQENTLRSLLHRAKDSQFGKHYRFAQLLRAPKLIEAYQQTVPIFDYQQLFEDWWQAALTGEKDVSWRGKIPYFALSSGSSGTASKRIPISWEMLKCIQRSNLRMLADTTHFLDLPSAFYGRDFLVLGGSLELRQEGAAMVGDISGINAKYVPKYLENWYKPGKQIAALQNWEKRLEMMVEAAPNWDVGTLGGIPAWVQVLLERIVERYRLSAVCELWQNLEVYVSGGVAFAPYRQRFEDLVGKPLQVMDTYYTSEGCLGYQAQPNNKVLPIKLMLDNGIFFEFVPHKAVYFEAGLPKSDAPVLDIGSIELGEDYALLLTTCAGTWRYVLGDIVRFVSPDEVQIVGRLQHFLSLCGEHLSVQNMNAGIAQLAERLNKSISPFTVKGDKTATGVVHHW